MLTQMPFLNCLGIDVGLDYFLVTHAPQNPFEHSELCHVVATDVCQVTSALQRRNVSTETAAFLSLCVHIPAAQGDGLGSLEAVFRETRNVSSALLRSGNPASSAHAISLSCFWNRIRHFSQLPLNY